MEFRESDVEYVAFRGSGPGGQHRNKCANCIRATHLPTGIVARSTSERSQRENKRFALEALKGKLDKMRDDALAVSRKDRRDAKPAASFGGVAIRTYRMGGPDSGVVDHRTGEAGTLDVVRRGRLDEMLAAFLRSEYNPGRIAV